MLNKFMETLSAYFFWWNLGQDNEGQSENAHIGQENRHRQSEHWNELDEGWCVAVLNHLRRHPECDHAQRNSEGRERQQRLATEAVYENCRAVSAY